jgi:hypothetical protein
MRPETFAGSYNNSTHIFFCLKCIKILDLSKKERGVENRSSRGQLTKAIKAYSMISLYVGSQRQHKGNCLVATHWPHQGLNYRPAGSKCSPRLGPVSKLAACLGGGGGCRAFDSPLSLLWRQQLTLKWVQSKQLIVV